MTQLIQPVNKRQDHDAVEEVTCSPAWLYERATHSAIYTTALLSWWHAIFKGSIACIFRTAKQGSYLTNINPLGNERWHVFLGLLRSSRSWENRQEILPGTRSFHL